MDSVILINDGGYMGMDNVCFPVEVYVSNLAEHGVAISNSEMERIGCDMSLFDGRCEWWFVIGDYNLAFNKLTASDSKS